MPAKHCPNCRSTHLETDVSAGQVVCLDCYAIVESGILVSEVGFSEGAGGRIHVQGAFVSNYSTGLSGFRGRGNGESSENVKKQGHERIRLVADQMGIAGGISRTAQRFFSLAVEARFNRGRRTEYVVASCLYLQCRYANSDKMLIDFSERLSINVFELGSTYLKLRSALHLKDPMPEVDPAIYNIRFAHRLDFGSENVKTIAADASRLVRRFRADWMTQGRRPAGVCGACMIIAARMSGFLRTPEEVAQVVKVSPITIRRRLMEFARTKVALKTVEEWRALNDRELDYVDPKAEPPIVVQNREKARILEEKKRVQRLREEGHEDGADEEEEDYDSADEAEEGRARKRRKGKEKETHNNGNGDNSTAANAGSSRLDINNLIQATADEYGQEGAGSDSDELDDENLAEMEQADYLSHLAPTMAPEDAKEAVKEQKRAARRFKQQAKSLHMPADLGNDLDALAELGEDGEGGEKEEALREVDDEDEEEDGGEGEGGEGDERGEGKGKAQRGATQVKAQPAFTDWDDEEAVLLHLGEKYFSEEANLFKLSTKELKDRVQSWITTRDARDVVREIEAIDHARKERDRLARAKPEIAFDDLDDEELEGYYVLEDQELQIRASLWLSSNGKWLQEDRERREKKAAYNRAHGIDPNKPKTKRKRKNAQKGPFNTAREAIDSFASQKKFSSRINYAALNSLGLGEEEGLQTFDDEDDEKDDDAGWEGDEKDEEDDKDDDEQYDEYEE